MRKREEKLRYVARSLFPKSLAAQDAWVEKTRDVLVSLMLKERQRAYQQEYYKRPEIRERRKAYLKKYCSAPEYKKRRLTFDQLPTSKARRKLCLAARGLFPHDQAARRAWVEEGMKGYTNERTEGD